MRRLLSLLSEEVRWGRLALMALAAGILVQVALPVVEGLLGLVTLLVFTLGGVLVERTAPRHPFLNSLFFGLFGVAFALGLFVLRYLGAEQQFPDLPIVVYVLIPMASFFPQALIGTWISFSIRRAREMGKEGQKREPASRKKRGEKRKKDERK